MAITLIGPRHENTIIIFELNVGVDKVFESSAKMQEIYHKVEPKAFDLLCRYCKYPTSFRHLMKNSTYS